MSDRTVTADELRGWATAVLIKHYAPKGAAVR